MYLLTGWRWPDSSNGWCEGSSSKEKASSSSAMVMSSSGYGRTAKANEDAGCNPSWWREESWRDDEGDKAENQIFFAPQAWSLAPGQRGTSLQDRYCSCHCQRSRAARSHLHSRSMVLADARDPTSQLGATSCKSSWRVSRRHDQVARSSPLWSDTCRQALLQGL